MEKEKIRTIEKEGMHCVLNGKKELIAVLRRDPLSKKHLIYFTKEGTSEDIAEILIRTQSVLEEKLEKLK